MLAKTVSLCSHARAAGTQGRSTGENPNGPMSGAALMSCCAGTADFLLGDLAFDFFADGRFLRSCFGFALVCVASAGVSTCSSTVIPLSSRC